MPSLQAQFDGLSYYTLSHPSSDFIHQYIVDAFAAQTADKETKPIKITFALLGLYLFLQKNYTGRQVQLAHMEIAKVKGRVVWPKIILPEDRGAITVTDVLHIPPGRKRDNMIKKWCESIWDSYSESHREIIEFLQKYLPSSLL